MGSNTQQIHGEERTETIDAAPSTEPETSLGLSENAAGALSYLFGFVTGLAVYLLEDENEFVRFHAVQSTLAFGGLFALAMALNVVGIALGAIPVIGLLVGFAVAAVSLLIAPIAFVLWVVLLIKAYRGDRFHLPVVGKMAERYV